MSEAEGRNRDIRVEVNQRSLIDKILARYASAGAVYRELLQNSDDAEASVAEVRFSTTSGGGGGDCAQNSLSSSSTITGDGGSDRGLAASSNSGKKGPGTVSQVVYRNNGVPFRDQDWSRLRKIAEGNPDVSKVGAFGVGAYAMFSVSEEPMVISGGEALAFHWRGDALWTRTGPAPDSRARGDEGRQEQRWTTFVLPSRDPYAAPDAVEFGKFLCGNLTFTKSLRTVRVYVNDRLRLTVSKEPAGRSREVTPPRSSSWWKNDGAVTSSSGGIFSLGSGNGSITETPVTITADLDDERRTSIVDARYISAVAHTRVSAVVARRMERVTKKKVPSTVNVQVFMGATARGANAGTGSGRADAITSSLSPPTGEGRIFIGFRTSQTTGLAAHLSAPFVPTVEREAIDLQDVALRAYNTELLEVSGMLMRMLLEHAMGAIGTRYEGNMDGYAVEDERLRRTGGDPMASSTAVGVDEADEGNDSGDKESTTSLYSFARFMAKGIKKKVVAAIKTVEGVVRDDESAELLNPPDPRPLSAEERDAVDLMRSFCPRRSTPDPDVGAAIAKGFGRCLPHLSPPALTQTGVARGSDAKLPNRGMEAFVRVRVVRRAVLESAREYHEVVAGCRPLQIEDLIAALGGEGEGAVMEESDVVRLLRWWTRYARLDPDALARGPSVKDNIRFFPSKNSGAEPADSRDGGDNHVREIIRLKDKIYSVNDDYLPPSLPQPKSVLPRSLREGVGATALGDASLKSWFSPIPVDIWATYISDHRCMTEGRPEDNGIRRLALRALGGEYSRREASGGSAAAAAFGGFLRNLLSERLCVPFDPPGEEGGRENADAGCSANCPSELYLPSADLAAFAGLHSFQKASPSLKEGGVSDDLLVAMGVRKTVTIDFLFSHLDTLRWSDNPKALVGYLRKASLTEQDLKKLRTTQYLPERQDKTRTYAPSELFLPNPGLKIFPFVKFLQWPDDDRLSDSSADGAFLKTLGCRVTPPLLAVMDYLETVVSDDKELRNKCLAFLYGELGPKGAYREAYTPSSLFLKKKVFPCLRNDPLGEIEQQKEICSADSCFYDAMCLCMGFPVLDPELEEYGKRFICASQPTPQALTARLMEIVARAKHSLNEIGGREYLYKQYCDRICAKFNLVFNFLSTRTNDFDKQSLKDLKANAFIPCRTGDFVEWHLPSNVYFQNTKGEKSALTVTLFHVVDFHPFLSAAGVKSEPSSEDFFQLLLNDPRDVLNKLGDETKYLTLLRRIASDPPFKSVTKEMTESPFLLALKVVTEGPGQNKSEDTSAKYVLARSRDIFIIDNSFFGRMFPILQAPHESDLEDFYEALGSRFISSSVNKAFKVIGGQRHRTAMTLEFSDTLRERTPLLISPSITSRPLVKDADKLLGENRLDVLEADRLKAVYTLGETVNEQDVTCCADSFGRRKNALYLTEGFDWFDVGNAIGGLILHRCQLEDAFLIGSLLETPLEQLRSRGFPVDRILCISPVSPEKPPPPMSSTEEDRTVNTSASRGILGEEQGYQNILQQMFPDCDESYIKSQLAKKPSLGKMRKLAESMASGEYPNKSATIRANNDVQQQTTLDELKHKTGVGKKVGKKLSRMLSPGKRGFSMPGAQLSTQLLSHTQRPQANPLMSDGRLQSPENDFGANQQVENMLKNSVKSARQVDPGGISAPETILTSTPEGLERGNNGCEIVSGKDLKPFEGPYSSGKAINGVRIFSTRGKIISDNFLKDHFHAVNIFANVLQNLCDIFSLKIASIAIYHDPHGNTIAFNSAKSLHFNIRYFCSLHYIPNTAPDNSCYSYWFTTMAHELAHNLVSAHNKDHGYYTESYIVLFLPKLTTFLCNRI